jgi:Uma2 family endonuclease
MTASSALSNGSLALEPSQLKRWTVQDYHRMGELGLFNTDERTELLAGQISLMAPKGTPHVTALHLLANALRAQLGERALVRTQDPIQLDDFSEPEPDLAVVQGSVLDYAEQHPRPEQVYLVVEVGDSTLRQDCEVKAKLYAQAGIADYWVLDLKNRQIHLFREPTSTGYTHHLILTEPNQMSPLTFSDILLSLSKILPPEP